MHQSMPAPIFRLGQTTRRPILGRHGDRPRSSALTRKTGMTLRPTDKARLPGRPLGLRYPPDLAPTRPPNQVGVSASKRSSARQLPPVSRRKPVIRAGSSRLDLSKPGPLTVLQSNNISHPQARRGTHREPVTVPQPMHYLPFPLVPEVSHGHRHAPPASPGYKPGRNTPAPSGRCEGKPASTPPNSAPDIPAR